MSTNEPNTDPFDYVSPSDLESPDANQPEYVLEHALVEHDHRPDEYAVTPIDTTTGVLTTWVAIEVDDMVDLSEWR